MSFASAFTSNFLMIQNPGEAPIEGFTVLGVSTSRDSTVTIGQFGSGNKHAVNLCLRNKIDPIVFCGQLRLGFFVEIDKMDDGISVKNFGRVKCRTSGKDRHGKSHNKTLDLGFSLDFGNYDWTELAMGLREFVANALDRTVREARAEDSRIAAQKAIQAAIKSKNVQVAIVGENQVRAKAGYTRIFIPLTPEVNQFYTELPKRFLHFSEPELLNQTILPKRDRNLENSRVACVYLNGVFIREVANFNQSSLFDYNFRSNTLRLDESRTVDDNAVRTSVAKALRSADKDTVIEVIEAALDKNVRYWEMTLDSYYMSCDNIIDLEEREKARENWREAIDKVTLGSVLTTDDKKELVEYAEKKGHKVIVTPYQSIVAAANSAGAKTLRQVLDANEFEGKEFLPATPGAVKAVDTVWSWAEEYKMTNNKPKPKVACFRELMNAESETLGFWEVGGDTVYIRADTCDGDIPPSRVLETALEEVAHYVTGSDDLSRDFQKYFMRMIVRILTVN